MRISSTQDPQPRAPPRPRSRARQPPISLLPTDLAPFVLAYLPRPCDVRNLTEALGPASRLATAFRSADSSRQAVAIVRVVRSSTSTSTSKSSSTSLAPSPSSRPSPLPSSSTPARSAHPPNRRPVVVPVADEIDTLIARLSPLDQTTCIEIVLRLLSSSGPHDNDHDHDHDEVAAAPPVEYLARWRDMAGAFSRSGGPAELVF
ncbi:hypothetical protein HKX48_001587 [Thoreauomyces humboldtii]|nr:hypothetical protein HKX48_001587 [Thoreauomyces humboldtii]